MSAPVVLSWGICTVLFALVPVTFLAYNRRLLRAVSPFKGRLGVDLIGFLVFLACLWAGALLRGRVEAWLRRRMAGYDPITLVVLAGATALCLFLLFRRRAIKG